MKLGRLATLLVFCAGSHAAGAQNSTPNYYLLSGVFGGVSYLSFSAFGRITTCSNVFYGDTGYVAGASGNCQARMIEQEVTLGLGIVAAIASIWSLSKALHLPPSAPDALLNVGASAKPQVRVPLVSYDPLRRETRALLLHVQLR
jgi:hypothetical protein